MIISASRRTDIPAFYADWFTNRLNAGYCLVKNPFNHAQIRQVSLLPRDVDGIVFWTKNAAPILPKIPQLDKFKFYFQYTITPYHSDIESGLADKQKVIIPSFVKLAENIGRERVIWRYDPIIITERYNFQYHVGGFSRLCELLAGSTQKCVISFVVNYKSAAKNLSAVGSKTLDISEKVKLVSELLKIAKSHEIELCACCEIPELYELGVSEISCVDAGLFGVQFPRDKHQREGCNCVKSVDIGGYNSCLNGCKYCYANHAGAEVIGRNYANLENRPGF
ncbi:MAG: DUF1848 domain-containing protein [Oscillospiraceae bacterium]|nr:DUF1848 domain-containing protein [Oscillospiraceae bacterium]